MGIMKLGLNYITDPFVTFFAGTTVLYTLFLFIDSLSRKVSGKQEDNFNARFGNLFRLAKKPAPSEEKPDFSTIVEVENMRIKLEDSTRLYEDILGKQYKERGLLNNQISVLQEEKAGLSVMFEESQKQNVSLQKQTSDLKNMITEMQEEHERVQEEFRAKIKAIEKEHERAEAKLHSEMQAMEKEHSAFKADMEEKLNILGNDKAALAQDLEKTEAEKEALQEQAASLKSELDKGRREREKENKIFQVQLENLEQEKNALASDLDGKITALEQEKTGLSGELEDFKKQYTDLEKDADIFKKQVAEVQAELREKGDSYGESAEKLKQKVEDMESENASLKTELSGSIPKEEYDIVKEKYDTVNAQLTQYKNMSMQLQSQLGQYRGEDTIQDPSQMLQNDPVTKTLYEENKDLSEKVDQYLDEINSLRFDLQELMSVRQENEKLRIELGKSSAVKKPDIPEEDKKKAEEGKRKKKKAQKKGAKRKKTGKAEKTKEKYEDNAVKMQMSGDSVDLALSDKDLIEEIEAPATPKTDEVPHIVKKEAEDSDKRGSGKPVKGADTGGKKRFNVFLPKLTTRKKKEKAIPLIQEIAGISKKEAEELVERIVIPVVKGVTQDDADRIKQQFKDAGILPRVREQV